MPDWVGDADSVRDCEAVCTWLDVMVTEAVCDGVEDDVDVEDLLREVVWVLDGDTVFDAVAVRDGVSVCEFDTGVQ